MRSFVELDGETRDVAFNKVIEDACATLHWTVIVPKGLFPHLFRKLFRARALHNKLSHVCSLPEDYEYKEEGKLAKAIDKWIGTRPVKEPDCRYVHMPQHFIDYIVNEKMNDEKLDLNFSMEDFSDYDSDTDEENRRWIPWRELWARESAKYLDEDAFWEHTYFWNDTSDEDSPMASALLHHD
ncbi:hypothetical protein K449DRAFT_203248 [Hypoxylon sp. EC38]|nr:hypothetical protein K449DRAFT_203248 [Hypoxylon sp. EC38]